MKISITYCTSWGYLNQALSLRESIERQFGVKAELIKGMGGVFEVSVGSTDTRTLAEGRYVYNVLVSSGATIYNIVNGNIMVYPGISSAP